MFLSIRSTNCLALEIGAIPFLLEAEGKRYGFCTDAFKIRKNKTQDLIRLSMVVDESSAESEDNEV